MAVQSAQPNLSMENLRAFPWPIPPVSEVEHYRQYLRELNEGFSALKARAQTQLAKLREYRQSLITAAVTGQLDIAGAA